MNGLEKRKSSLFFFRGVNDPDKCQSLLEDREFIEFIEFLVFI